MTKANKNLNAPETTVKVGQFSKKEGANYVIQGHAHLHSTPLGEKDPSAQITKTMLQTGKPAGYPWEKTNEATTRIITDSASRQSVIDEILGSVGLQSKRNISSIASSVLEELTTNAIYHAYRASTGQEKYRRKDKISLGASEGVSVKAHYQKEGLYLEVEDNGGALDIETLRRALKRCYSLEGNQIEQKESGAGLGFYFIFEMASHIRVDVSPGKKTRIAIWLAERNSFCADTFTFNFFIWGKSNE